jgi:hypothetical protein
MLRQTPSSSIIPTEETLLELLDIDEKASNRNLAVRGA